MNYFKYIFTKEFLFYVNPVRLETVDRVFLVLSLFALVMAVAAWIWTRLDGHLIRKNLVTRLGYLSLAFGLLGVLWFGFRFENIAWFGTHFAFILLLVLALVWKARIGKYWFFHYRKDAILWEHEQLKNKYLKM